jgi:hypothetical protein
MKRKDRKKGVVRKEKETKEIRYGWGGRDSNNREKRVKKRKERKIRGCDKERNKRERECEKKEKD